MACVLILAAQQLLVPLLVRALFLQAVTVYFGCLSSVVWSFAKIYKRNFKISWSFYKKSIIKLCMNWRLDFKCRQLNLLPLDISIYKLKSFQIKIEHWSIIVALKFFKENVLVNFGVMVVFVKVAFEITKRAQHSIFTLIYMFSCFSKFTQLKSFMC